MSTDTLSPMISAPTAGLEPMMPTGETRPAEYEIGARVLSRGPWD